MRIRPLIVRSDRKLHLAHEAFDEGWILDCALGCNALGTSDQVVAAANAYRWNSLSSYPDASYRDFKEAVCSFWAGQAQITPDNVKVANGSMSVLSRLATLFVEPGVAVLGYVPQFKDWMEIVTMMGGQYDAIPLDPGECYAFDIARFLAGLSGRHSVVYLDNPNNPTGQLIGLDDIEVVASNCAKNQSVLIVDEAFGDYVDEQFSAIRLLDRYDNIIVTRTLSKGMGVAEFRVGYAILSCKLGQFYDRIDLPFPVSAVAALLAGEALKDRAFVQASRQKVQVQKARLVEELARRGYTIGETCCSCPIFLLGHENERIDLHRALLEKGIRTAPGREFDNLGQNYVRVNSPVCAEDFLRRLDA
jgi:histidinol-phosphate aminotransferase